MTEQRPNLVYIFPDEYRQQALGFWNDGDPVLTPNLNRLASDGLVLTHAVSNFPVCSPYRGMLMTGKYPFSNGVIGNCSSRTIKYGIELSASERCLSDVLSDAGYSLGYIGKWHLDMPQEEQIPFTEGWRGKPGEGSFWDTYTPPGPRRHGFDFWHAYGCCDQHLTPHYWEGDARIDERIDVNEWSVKHETAVAVDYLHNHSGEMRDDGRPFALFVAYNPPHMPFDQVPPEYCEPYAGKSPEALLTRPNVRTEGEGAEAPEVVRNYFAAVTGIDEQVGRILDALDETGLAEDTIVIFTSDHGEMMGSHDRMHKVVWFDESLLVPFIIRWPGRISPGYDDLLLSVPDIMPTLLSMAGLAEMIPDDVEGRDLAAALLGDDGTRPDSALYLRINPADPHLGARGLRTHRYTFVVVRDKDGETTLLYDNRRDPYQMEEIADTSPDVVHDLRVELMSRLQRTKDPWVE